MLLAINIGNTTTKFGFFDGGKLIHSVKIETDKNSKEKDFSLLDKEFESQKDLVEKTDGIIIGSVVPDYTDPLSFHLKKRFSIEPLFVGADIDLPITLPVRDPAEVGADLLANMVAADALYPKPSVVVDCGTATTFCILSEQSEFTGCVIAPGIRMLVKSLASDAALLPEIKIVKPDSVIGRNTIECMESGIYFGYVGIVHEILTHIKAENKRSYVVGTGGNIGIVRDEISDIEAVNENLTLEGLRLIYDYNTQGL